MLNRVCVFLLLGLSLSACETDSGVPLDEALAQKPTLHGLGVNVADIPTSHDQQPRLFYEYGFPIDGAHAGWKNLAHPEFYLPMSSTLVRAVSNGVVVNITEVEGPHDLLIMVRPDDAPIWTLGYEHVSDVLVSVGDRVSVDQHIASLSPDQGGFMPGFGKTSLMVFVDNGRGENLSYCPFMLLDSSIRHTGCAAAVGTSMCGENQSPLCSSAAHS